MNLDAVRTFLAVVDSGHFHEAAVELSITQQAVSKRVAALEKELGVRLLTRAPAGARPTIDGQAFLPHARALLQAEERAAASVRPGRRALRVDVVGRRLAPAALLRDFHRVRPDVELDVVTLDDAEAALAALGSGTIDASFRAVTRPAHRLPDGIRASRVLDEPLQLLTGPGHELAAARTVAPAALAGRRIWLPGHVAGTEWAMFYDALAAAFGLTVEVVGPHSGTEPLIDAIADSTELATFVGADTHVLWPASYDLRRIDLREPVPVYPHSLIWHAANPHPALALLRDHLAATSPRHPGTGKDSDTWTPDWAR
ncbi:LysR family transcriptional regulator [Streptomyces sp. YIM S03343]